MCKMANRIKRCRTDKNMTQEELAEKLGLKKSAIAKYENGRVENIKRSTIEEMSNIFNCKPSYLMGWDDQKERLSSFYLTLNEHESKLVNEYRKLNNMGKLKILQTAQEMNCSPLYNDNYQEELKAAHQRTDIEITEAMIKHDDDIMNDDNF